MIGGCFFFDDHNGGKGLIILQKWGDNREMKGSLNLKMGERTPSANYVMSKIGSFAKQVD